MTKLFLQVFLINFSKIGTCGNWHVVQQTDSCMVNPISVQCSQSSLLKAQIQ